MARAGRNEHHVVGDDAVRRTLEGEFALAGLYDIDIVRDGVAVDATARPLGQKNVDVYIKLIGAAAAVNELYAVAAARFKSDARRSIWFYYFESQRRFPRVCAA